jgi:hypothetical protein
MLFPKIGVALQAFRIAVPGLRHHLGVRPARLDERRDKFTAGVMKPVMIKSEFVSCAIECRAMRDFG